MTTPVRHGCVAKYNVFHSSKHLTLVSLLYLYWLSFDPALQVLSQYMHRGCFQSSLKEVRSFQAVSNLMAVRDGKRKQSKKSGTSQSSAPSPSSDPPPSSASHHSSQQLPPQRVSGNINIPIRRQIEWARAKKEAIRLNSAPFRAKNVKTAYRKKLGECSKERT
jgi:hypothetical protein